MHIHIISKNGLEDLLGLTLLMFKHESKACGTWSVTSDNSVRQLAELLQFV